MTRPPASRTLAALATLTITVLLAACGKSSATPATQVAARVNKEEISVHQINFVLQRQNGLKPEQTEAASRQVLERLIDQEVAVQKAEELKLDREPRVMQALAAARNEIIARAYMERAAEQAAKPTAEDVQAYYDGKPALFKQRRVYTLQELQVQAGPDALKELRDVVTQAKSIQEVTEHVKQKNLPARANQNTVAAEGLPLPMAERFLQMKAGQAMFLPAPAGARIVVIAAAQEAAVPLDKARPAIEAALTNERRRQTVESDLKALRQGGKVEYVGKFAEPAASGVAPVPAAEPQSTEASASAPAGDVDTGMVNRGLAGLK